MNGENRNRGESSEMDTKPKSLLLSAIRLCALEFKFFFPTSSCWFRVLFCFVISEMLFFTFCFWFVVYDFLGFFDDFKNKVFVCFLMKWWLEFCVWFSMLLWAFEFQWEKLLRKEKFCFVYFWTSDVMFDLPFLLELMLYLY